MAVDALMKDCLLNLGPIFFSRMIIISIVRPRRNIRCVLCDLQIKPRTLNRLLLNDRMAAVCAAHECVVGIKSVLLLRARYDSRAIPTFRFVTGTGYALPSVAQSFRRRHTIYPIRGWLHITGRWIVLYPAKRINRFLESKERRRDKNSSF